MTKTVPTNFQETGLSDVNPRNLLFLEKEQNNVPSLRYLVQGSSHPCRNLFVLNAGQASALGSFRVPCLRGSSGGSWLLTRKISDRKRFLEVPRWHGLSRWHGGDLVTYLFPSELTVQGLWDISLASKLCLHSFSFRSMWITGPRSVVWKNCGLSSSFNVFHFFLHCSGNVFSRESPFWLS